VRQGPESARPLAALLGSTRARALRVLGERCCTTTELAQQIGVSVSSASEHAAVLREAGLIVTRRRGSSVTHVISQPGRIVIDSVTQANAPSVPHAGRPGGHAPTALPSGAWREPALRSAGKSRHHAVQRYLPHQRKLGGAPLMPASPRSCQSPRADRPGRRGPGCSLPGSR
jgi:DNA-binding transcriptional ArsR family regulator